MSTLFTPPLSVSFVWNFADSEAVNPVIEVVKKSFARDKDKPFSRGLNIPLFFYSSQNANEIPDDIPAAQTKKNVIFVFTSVNTNGRDNWREYVEGLSVSPSTIIVPIALDKGGLAHHGHLSGTNCIRLYEWPPENREFYAIVSLAHEIYRHGCNEFSPDDPSKGSSITIFLSHAKAGDTGRLHSEEIKKFIDNTNLNRFFDSTEISPGFQFDQEIEKSVKKSTLVAIESDAYSSRYWCQREILCAKENGRPIVVVNSLNDYEDRIFPAASNVPCVHVSSETPLSQRDILRILSAAILETIRCTHSIQCHKLYKHVGWIENDCELSARPPEIRQALKVKSSKQKKICYPEPPIYSDEADWHNHLDIEAFTPLWNLAEQDNLLQQRIGISISDVQGDGFSSNHIHPDHLIRLAQDIARHLLARSGTLIYGGDLRPDGFTEFILDEASILKERIGGDLPKVENHLAWPIYTESEPRVVSWRARYSQVMKTEEHEIASDVASGLARDVFLPPTTPDNSYVWSRCLTEMREKSIASSTARICAGGKLSGYKGKMPGVLEEIVLALNSQKPTFLLGAFGGVVGGVCNLLLTKAVPEELTEDWQNSHNSGYSELQAIAKSHGKECDYSAIIEFLQKQNVSDLAMSCGLSEDEYMRIMNSPFVDECLYLILKGLNKLSGRNS